MNKVNALRNEFNLSMMELARQTSISDSTISKLEKGRRDISRNHIDPLCSFFGVSSDYLLGRSKSGIHVYYYDESGFTTITEDELNELYNSCDIRLVNNKLLNGKSNYKRILSERKSIEFLNKKMENINNQTNAQLDLLNVICNGNELLFNIMKDLIYIDNLSEDDTKLKTLSEVVQFMKASLPKE